ncbi:MAG: phosphotransferase [Ornithinimicrobium sp.]
MRRSDLALAGIACAAVPGMQPVSVQEVSRSAREEAVGHQTAIVEDSTGRTWVVRVPLSTVAGAELERNEALVAQLGKHLPFKVPAATGFASLGPDQGRAAVYPYVEGSALNLHRLPPGPGLASAVGRAIAAVHNISSGVFEDYGVPVFDAARHRDRCVSELDRAAATGLVPTGLLARWEEALDAASLWRFAATPVHGSLNGWAFLVAFTDDDAGTGRVVALTHWDHAMVGDPAQDFAILADQLTPPALDSVLESYSLARSTRPDPHLVHRAKLAAEMRLIKGLAQAASAGEDALVQTRVEELRKLDRLTAADRSLLPSTPVSPIAETPENDRATQVTEPDGDAAGDEVDDGDERPAADEVDKDITQSVSEIFPDEDLGGSTRMDQWTERCEEEGGADATERSSS